MKTKEELIIINEELENQNQKNEMQNEDELEQVAGGIAPGRTYWKQRPVQ